MIVRAIIVLDDDPNDRRLIEQVLGEAFPETEVLDTDDAEEARGMCDTFAVDCVLVDYKMPRVDGVTFTQQLRCAHPFMPIVLITGVGDEILVGRAFRGGASDYIAKSRVTADAIKRVVTRAVEASARMRLIAAQRSELERFGVALTHDFQAPLEDLRKYSGLMAEQVAQGDAKHLRENLAAMNQAAHRLSILVEDLSNEPSPEH